MKEHLKERLYATNSAPNFNDYVDTNTLKNRIMVLEYF